MAKLQSKSGACSSHTQGAKANCLQHNRREGKLASYVLADRSKDNITFYEAEDIRNVKTMKTLQHRAEVEYTRRTGQKCQKSFTPYRESVLVVHDHVTPDMMDEYRKKAEAETGWRVIGLWYHKDEGYHRKKKKEGETTKLNYHIHCLWDCQDHRTGKIIRPTSRKMFSRMQDILADCVGMERGEFAALTGKEHLQRNEFILQQQREEAEELQQKCDELTQRNTELEKHNGELSQSIQEKDQELQELRQQVGAGAKMAAFFGVGELADIRSNIKTSEETAKEALKAKEKAEKALQDAKEARADELATARIESRQEGYKEAISAVCTAANLHITGKEGKETAEDIGKTWRWNFDKQKQLQSETDSLVADKKQLQSEIEQLKADKEKATARKAASIAIEKEKAAAYTLARVNRLLFRVGATCISEATLDIAAENDRILGKDMPGDYDILKDKVCRAIKEWGGRRGELRDPKALQLLKQLFIIMKEAWEKLLRLVGSSPEAQKAVLNDVKLQLDMSAGDCYGWEKAVEKTPERYIADIRAQLQEEVEEDQAEEQSYSHGWRV